MSIVKTGRCAVLFFALSSCRGSEEKLPDSGAGSSATAAVPPGSAPSPVVADDGPIEKEINEKTKLVKTRVAADIECARRPGAKIDTLNECIKHAISAGDSARAAPDSGVAPTSAQLTEAMAAAATQFRGAMTGAGGEAAAEHMAREAYDLSMKKAEHDELARMAIQNRPGSDGTGSPHSTGGQPTGGHPGGSKGGGGAGDDLAGMLPLLFAAGCMAYTGSVGGCALAAQLLGSLLGSKEGGTVDVDRARRISEGATQLVGGKCDSQCMARLYDDTGAKDAVDHGIDDTIKKRVNPATAKLVRDSFGVFQCISKIDKSGTAAASAVVKCGLGGPAAERVAGDVSNCVEQSHGPEQRKACFDRILGCVAVIDGTPAWSCR